MSRIAAYVPDLMDRSKVAAAAAAGNGEVTFVASPADLGSVDADLVVVDLSRPGVLEALPAIKARTIGFGRHTQRDLLDAAQAAGCDLVLKRSDFFPRVEELLSP